MTYCPGLRNDSIDTVTNARFPYIRYVTSPQLTLRRPRILGHILCNPRPETLGNLQKKDVVIVAGDAW